MPTQTAKCQEKKSDLVQADLAAQSETYLREQGRAMNLEPLFEVGPWALTEVLADHRPTPQEVGASPLYR